MRWKGGRQSTNIEDRRGGRAGGGGRRGLALGGGTTILLVVVGLFFGINPAQILGLVGGAGGQGGGGQGAPASPAQNDEMTQFVATVLGDTETTWNQVFQSRGARYQEPVLVLFEGSVNSACGRNSSAVGPFYCPGDHKLYIDLSFFRDLRQRFGAPGDFAQAYVIAHEVGHHIQSLTGVSERVHAMKRRVSETERNELSVRQELQADCYAGVWGHHAATQRNMLEEGDIEEAMRAAQAIGDDALQRGAGQRVRPESFTHGSSEQRARWFRVGLQHGDIDHCDTFSASRL